MYSNRLLLLVLVFITTNFFSFALAKKTLRSEFSCDESSTELIANGVILKFKDNHLQNDTNSDSSIHKKLASKKHLKLKKLLNADDTDINYKLSKLNKHQRSKALAKLTKLRKLESDYKLDKIFTLEDNQKLNCKELKAIIHEYKNADEVETIEPNFIREVLAPVSLNQELNSTYMEDQGFNSAWGAEKIGSREAQEISTGDGVKVAMIDSGIDYNHPSLWENVWVNSEELTDTNHDGFVNIDDADINGNKKIDSNLSINESRPNLSSNIFGDYYDTASELSPEDGFGHGSHVAGIIAANNKDDQNFNGVATDAKLMSIRIFDDQGKFTSVSELLRGIRSAIIDGARVINASIGGSYYSKLEEDTYRLADTLGVVVIAAAGNSNSNNDYQPVYPANYETVLSVAASDKTDSISSFSNYGESVDVAAPGSQIPSTMNNNSYLAQRLPSNFIKNVQDDHGIWMLSGTSMATPHVSGLSALILSKNPNLSPAQVRDIIKNSTDATTGNKTTLYGRVNAVKALTLAETTVGEFDNEVNLRGIAQNIFEMRSKRNKNFSSISNSSSQSINDTEMVSQVLRAINAVDTNMNGIVGTGEVERFNTKIQNINSKFFRKLDVNNDGEVNNIDETYIRYIYSLINVNLDESQA